MTHRDDVAARFAAMTKDHVLIVAKDEGLYRHLQFRNPTHQWNAWFDLITVPGALMFQGDMDGFAFRRMPDMFEFFRGSAWDGRPNLGYWQEKLTGPEPKSVMTYSSTVFESWLRQEVADLTADGRLPGLPAAVEREVFESEEFGWDDETVLRKVLDDFSHYENEDDRYDHRKNPDFEFTDLWDVSFRDYDQWFVWACHAILWGIGKYDVSRGRKSNYRPAATVPSDPLLPADLPQGRRRSVVTVELPGGAL